MLTVAEIGKILDLQREIADVWTPDNGALIRSMITAAHARPDPFLAALAMHATARTVIEAAEVLHAPRAIYVVITWSVSTAQAQFIKCGSLRSAIACAASMFRLDAARAPLERGVLRTD